jgi:hypothetical protein
MGHESSGWPGTREAIIASLGSNTNSRSTTAKPIQGGLIAGLTGAERAARATGGCTGLALRGCVSRVSVTQSPPDMSRASDLSLAKPKLKLNLNLT